MRRPLLNRKNNIGIIINGDSFDIYLFSDHSVPDSVHSGAHAVPSVQCSLSRSFLSETEYYAVAQEEL